MMEAATWMVERDLNVLVLLPVRSGHRVVMMAESSRPRLTSTSVRPEEVARGSFITQDTVG